MQFPLGKLLLIILIPVFIYVYPRPPEKYNYFEYGVSLVPHPKKAHKGGEDAFFVNKNLLAVADGVSSWNGKGVDPSKYSKEFCRLIGVLLDEDYKKYANNPKSIIQEVAHRNTNLGTSTIVLVNLDKTKPVLRTSYVGDSIYVIYRKQNGTWKMIFEAAIHQVKFNSPYQLGYKRGAPHKAQEFVHEVQDKDIVVVGSDGIFDNMNPTQILVELNKFIGPDDELKDAQAAARHIADVAFNLSLNTTYVSPFRINAVNAGFKLIKGGKSDDITAAVGQIRIGNKKDIRNGNISQKELDLYYK